MHSIEQQIYASLAIEGLKAGHHTHASTPGLSANAIERHEQICNRWGSYEPGVDFTRALVHVPLWLDQMPPSAPSHHVVVLITYQGRDGSGRPGAVLRHIVRLSASQFAQLDFNPFHLLRSQRMLESWQPQTPFPALDDYVDPTTVEDLQSIFPERYPLLRAMLERTLGTGKLHLAAPADSPAAEETLAQLFELVPVSVRRALSLATFSTKRPDDYRLAVHRQVDATLRASLARVQETPPPDLDPAAAEYVDRLFAALDTKNHERAMDLIRGYEGPVDTMSFPAAMETIAGDDELGSAAPSSASGDRHVAAPPEMPYQRHWSQERKRSRTPLIAAVAVVAALVAAGIWWMSQRGSSSDPMTPARSTSQLARIEAASLADFVERHRTLLGQMVVGGTRDFDLREEMAAAARTWDERVQQAVNGDIEALDVALESAGGEATDAPLRAAAQRLEAAAREGEALGLIVRGGDVETLRAGADVTTGTLTLAPVEGDFEGSLGDALDYAQALLASADAMGPWAQASSGRDAAAWSVAAAALNGAVHVFPDALRAPRRVSATAAVSAAMVDVLGAENPSTLRAWAYAVPYEVSRLQETELESAVSNLRQAAAQLGQTPPPAVTAVDRFYGTLWDEVAPSLARGRGAAAGLLEALAGVCGQDSPICAVDHYAAHVARWKLEAWRLAPAPSSAEARQLLARLGEASLPAPGPADLAEVLGVFDRMEKSPIPAPADVVSAAQAVRSRVARGFYASLLDDWLGRNQRGAATTQEAFQRKYQELVAKLAALRSAQGAAAADAFARLRADLAQVSDGDLTRAEAAGEKARAAAVRSLREACAQRVDVPLRKIEVHLLRDTDYAGTKRALARVRLQLRRMGADGPPLLQVDAPPMLAAPGVGFEAVAIDLDKKVALAPGDELLLVATDSSDGVVWFHRVVQPASGRHVAEALAAVDEIRVSPEAARQFSDGSGAPPRGDGGAVVARVHLALADGWWAALAAALPGLP